MNKRSNATSKFNAIYFFVLCIFIYSWPYTVYKNVGHPMPSTTSREKFIIHKANEYAEKMRITIRPRFRIGEVPASVGALSGAAVIIVSPAMLNTVQFTEQDVEFVIAHEIGHLSRYDAYRFWTTWRRDWAEQRESSADVIAVGLVGCDAMAEAIRHHREAFMLGYQAHTDPHPHPKLRYEIACSR